MNSAAENLFCVTLADVNKGNVLAELSNELSALIGAVRTTGKKGSLRMKLTITPDDNGETSAVEVEVECRLPRPDRPKTVFFLTEDNRLTRKNPLQPELKLGVVEGGKAEVSGQKSEVSA